MIVIRICLRAVSVALLWFLTMGWGQAAELTVQFQDKSAIAVDFRDSTFNWVTVEKNGTMTDRTIAVSEIQSLKLSRSKSSEILAKVRSDINALGDPSYSVREAAEKELVASGGAFKNLLNEYTDHPSLETRYRIKRLLKKLERTRSIPVELDRLELNSGTVLMGEAVNFNLEGNYRGNVIRLDRSRVLALKPMAKPSNRRKSEPAKIEIFHEHLAFDEPQQQKLEFETQVSGARFGDRASIDRAFVDRGVMFNKLGGTGYVGVSVFSFKYDGLPVGGRSACLYNTGRTRGQFKGVMEIRFCHPGNARRAAGVKQVGVFIARVKHSRDIVMEAYNRHGDVLATVEATDQQCVFAGVKSNELITHVRVFSNPWLDGLTREVDEDYAIDTLRFSNPIAINAPSVPDNRAMLSLRNGDLVNASSISVTPDQRIRARVSGISPRAADIKFAIDEVTSLQFPRAIKPTDNWNAMLSDGSIVAVTPGTQFRSPLLGQTLNPQTVTGFWPPRTWPRYPLDGDIPDGGSLVVFPTCRIRSPGLKLDSKQVSWTVSKKIQQQLMRGRENPKLKQNQEDPTPTTNSFRWSDRNAEQKPAFWNGVPKSDAAGNDYGVVEMTDGQRIVFGSNQKRQLKHIDPQVVTLIETDGNNVINIPIIKIRGLIFPQKASR